MIEIFIELPTETPSEKIQAYGVALGKKIDGSFGLMNKMLKITSKGAAYEEGKAESTLEGNVAKIKIWPPVGGGVSRRFVEENWISQFKAQTSEIEKQGIKMTFRIVE